MSPAQFFDLDSEAMRKTPERAAKAWTELTKGYSTSLHSVVNEAFFDVQLDLQSSGAIQSTEQATPRLITVSDIPFNSTCEHHLLPFHGKVHIGVVVHPRCKVLGLSKYARICEMYSRRLQVQERLTEQVCGGVWDAYKTY